MALDALQSSGVENPSNLQEHIDFLIASTKMTPAMRGFSTRSYLSEKGLNIADLAIIMGIKEPDVNNDIDLLVCVVNIQNKLGFKREGWLKSQSGIFDEDTLRAYIKWYSDVLGAEASSKGDIGESVKNVIKAPTSLEKKEALNVNVELTKPSDIVFIGDSNAALLCRFVPGSRNLSFGGKSSEAVLAIVQSPAGRKALKGAKVAIIRVGGNDGSRDPEQYTLKNIKEIVAVARSMGIPDVRIITRPPYSVKHKSVALRQRSLARMGMTEKIFGMPGELKNFGETRIGVIDAYNLLADKTGHLREDFTPKKDLLHMKREGYVKLLEHIFGEIGAKNALRWIL